VLATAALCLLHDRTTDVHFTERPISVDLDDDVYHLLPFLQGITSLTYNGKSYDWKCHTALIDDQTNCLLATLHSGRYVERDIHKMGSLVITGDGKEVQDLAVVSALVLQERSEKRPLAVCPQDYSA